MYNMSVRIRFGLRQFHSNHFFRYIISAESGHVIIWNRLTETVIFKEEQPGVRQLTLLENDTKFLTVSKPPPPAGTDSPKTNALGVFRSLPGQH